MTPANIKEKVERYLTKDNIENEIILDGIEESISWLGNMGYVINTINEEFEEKLFYTLPKDVLGVIKVEDIEEETYYENWKVDGNLIRFGETGKYRIFLNRNPIFPTGIDEELDIHPLLQYAILDYVKGFCKVTIDDTSEDGHRLMQKFKEDALKAYKMIRRNRDNVKQWRVIRSG